MTGIYKITNKITGDFYIGKATNLKKRKYQHLTLNAYGHGRKFDADLHRYGVNNFEFTVIEYCSREELLERERYYIDLLQPAYNVIVRGRKRDQDFCRRVSDGTKRWWNSLPEKTKDKIISNNLTGPAVGHSVSPETREKISRKVSEVQKQRVMIVETGEVFDSIGELESISGHALEQSLHIVAARSKQSKVSMLKSVETNGDECTRVGREMSCRPKCTAS